MNRTNLRAWMMGAIAGLVTLLGTKEAVARVEFARDFAPSESWTKPVEQPYRQDVCLNGSWQFQPVPLPRDWKRGTGTAPELALPVADRWEKTPIRIPSPWNVNTWGAARKVGEGTTHPYWPSSVYYPSYPAHWDGVEMGWLRRTFTVPKNWDGKRIIIHFEALGGDARILVNGQQAGTHFDRFLPCEVDITDFVKRDGENELLVGVRSLRLFDQTSSKYKHMRTPYPPGSNTDNLVGIWQDVFLLGLPAVRMTDVFVKPWVERDMLEVELALCNETSQDQTVVVAGKVSPWINLAGTNVLEAPEPKWRLDNAAMSLAGSNLVLKAGEKRTITLGEKVNGRLKLWSPDAPNLNAVIVELQNGGRMVDCNYTRFGWREAKIVGTDLMLNGSKMTLFGDLLHPFGPMVNSRRYVWAWYQMIKDMHGNAVRPHAQPHPRHYLDLADEMGLMVLDETAMFGSSLQLNFESPRAWPRFAEHYDRLILRDRNHPSVFGWSWGNELFAIFIYDKAITKEQTDEWYRQLAELGSRGRRLDPARNWFSCDGDEDLRGTMPVWNKHFGHGLPRPEWLPQSPAKPLMVGESGGSYYARPKQLAEFNGDRAYENYAGRNEALAIDVYQNIVKLARPRLAFFSPAETAWFGLEHLNLGYHDYTRLPNTNDGIWFKPFEEGKPGVQPERLPPYVSTLNPGWDPALPLYKPLAMFDAQKAAQAPGNPLPCAWDHKPEIRKPVAKAMESIAERAVFAGSLTGAAALRFAALGVTLAPERGTPGSRFMIVDNESLSADAIAPTRKSVDAVLASKGIVLVLCSKNGPQWLPEPVVVTGRTATMLQVGQPHAWTDGISQADLYFGENEVNKQIIRSGLDGTLVKQGQTLLKASDTDWSLFNEAPENAKCAAVVLYEHLQKPSGIVLAAVPQGQGSLVLSTLDYQTRSAGHDRLWRILLVRMGLSVGDAKTATNAPAKGKEHDLLLDGPPENK